MKWCRNCECEFEDYVEVCSDCGQTLETYEPEGSEDKEGVILEYKHNVKLASCSNNEETNLLISVLASYNIEASVQYEGSGSYLNIIHGVNFQGSDVMVAVGDLEEAQKVLKTFSYSHEIDEEDYEGKVLNSYSRKKRIVTWIIILLLILPLFIVTSMSIIERVIG